MGSVIKLPGKRRKPYAVVVTTGWVQLFDDNGVPSGKPKQQRKYVGYYQTRKEALQALVSLNDQTPTPVKESPHTAQNQAYIPTFAQMWRDVRAMKISGWAASTISNHDSSFERSAPIHNKRMDTITYMDLQKLMNAYGKEGKTKAAMNLYKAFMSLVFNEAEKMGYITGSPVRFVKVKPTAEAKARQALPPEIIRNVYDSHCVTRDIVLILCYTGLRINELLRVKEVKDGYVVTGSKTTAGKNRIVPIHPQIKECMTRFLASKKLDYDSYRLKLVSDCAVYGMKFTYHECRHTFITLANKYGMDLYALKKIVGHSTKDVTESVYTHIQVETLQREISKIPMIDQL